MLEMVEYAERVPKVNNGNMWKDSEVLRWLVWLFIFLRLFEGLETFLFTWRYFFFITICCCRQISITENINWDEKRHIFRGHHWFSIPPPSPLPSPASSFANSLTILTYLFPFQIYMLLTGENHYPRTSQPVLSKGATLSGHSQVSFCFIIYYNITNKFNTKGQKQPLFTCSSHFCLYFFLHRCLPAPLCDLKGTKSWKVLYRWLLKFSNSLDILVNRIFINY